MDRSFLSLKQVIEAAKNFVCIRLISYENQAEAEFVSKLVNGPVANTAFAILAPDGTRALAGRGPGRGPRDLFVDADAMAKGMDAVAAKYSAKDTSGTPQLPITHSPKIGLAVAAGDLQPLVVVVEEKFEKRASRSKGRENGLELGVYGLLHIRKHIDSQADSKCKGNQRFSRCLHHRARQLRRGRQSGCLTED